MKNFPSVINDLINAANEISIGFDGPLAIKAQDAVQRAKMYRDYIERQEMVSLLIEDSGDKNVGINPNGIEVSIWKGLVETTEERAEIKRIFCDAFKKFADFPIRCAMFDDECPECENKMAENKCKNKHCLNNLEDEVWPNENRESETLMEEKHQSRNDKL